MQRHTVPPQEVCFSSKVRPAICMRACFPPSKVSCALSHSSDMRGRTEEPRGAPSGAARVFIHKQRQHVAPLQAE